VVEVASMVEDIMLVPSLDSLLDVAAPEAIVIVVVVDGNQGLHV